MHYYVFHEGKLFTVSMMKVKKTGTKGNTALHNQVYCDITTGTYRRGAAVPVPRMVSRGLVTEFASDTV